MQDKEERLRLFISPTMRNMDDGDPFKMNISPSFPLFNDPLSEKAPRSIVLLRLFRGILRKWLETWTRSGSDHTKHWKGFEQFSLITNESHEIVE